MTRITDLRNLILKAKHAYYYSNEPIISDAEYDALEDELRQLAPEDPVLAVVGSPVPGGSILTKARHAMPMGSQNKVNSEAEFRAWAAKWPGSAIHASLKGDGASAAAYYEDGRLVQAISRGDGLIGEDITANAIRFKGLPAWVGDSSGGFSGAVRFEVILTVEDWGSVDPARSKNPRNAGTGIMGRKNGHQSDYLTIFAFDLDESSNGQSVAFNTETAKLSRLVELGFNVIAHQRCETPDEAIAYYRQIAAERDTLPIWIDGVVMKFDDLTAQAELGVTSGRPKGQVAWKFDSVGMETVLEGVVVSGGHTGALNPTAQLRPVEIGGTTVSNASLANYDEIARLDVAIGDSVWVVKANDIIPKIIRVTQRPAGRIPIVPPDACPFCQGEVGRRQTHDGTQGVIVECRNPECPKKSAGKIKRWIASLDILGIGESVLEAMLDTFELEDAADLYTLRERQAELACLIINTEKSISLGEKRAASILNAIDATRNLTLSQFLGSLGLDHLGKRRVHLMMQAAGGQLDTLEDWRSGKLRNPSIAEAAGVPNIGEQIQDGIDAMASVIDKLLAAVTVLPPENDIPSSEEINMKTVCISGKLPSGKKKADYADSLRAIGYELVDEVSKGLDYLVLADPDSTSSKAEKARKLNISVISEEALEQLIAKGPDAQTSVMKSPPVEATSAPAPVMKKTEPGKQEKPAAERAQATDASFRRFEFNDGKSSKFWSIRIGETEVDLRYGRIGTEGQSQTKSFDTLEAAQRHAEKVIAEKTGKGYQEIDSVLSTDSEATEDPPLASSEPRKPKATKQAADSRDKGELEETRSTYISDLVEAIKNADTDLVASILDRGFDPNTRFGFGRKYGISPLHLAAESAYRGISNHAFLKVVPMLFEATEKKAWSFGRLMGVGVREENLLKIISILLDKGADPLAISGEGNTPIEVEYAIGDFSRINELFSRLHATLVPPFGSAPTVQGELLRAVGKLGHERFGNGWCNLIDGGYEFELDYLHGFFNGPEAAEVFSEPELKWARLAASMVFIVAYEESGAKPIHVSRGGKLWRNKRTILNGWECAKSEWGDDVLSSDPFEAVEDFCIEYCRRQPPTSKSLTDIFDATLTDTPTKIHPELQDEFSTKAGDAWLAVLATVTDDLQVIDRLIKNKDAPGRRSLGSNPHLEAKHIDALAKNGVDRMLASNQAVAANKLNSWAKNKDPWVRKAVAENPTTPMATLVKLSKDAELDVRQAARNQIQKREEGWGEAERLERLVFGDDPQTRVWKALIRNDLDAFVQELNRANSPDALVGLLPFVCSMPISIEQRLIYANHLREKGAAASGDFIGPLIAVFIVALGKKGAEAEVAAVRDYLLRIIGQGISLGAIPAKSQCKLYEYRRKGRREASEVLLSLIEHGMPVKPLSDFRPDKDGNSFLEKAVYYGDTELASYLAQSTTSAVDQEECMALSIAVEKKKLKIIDQLLATGPDRFGSAIMVKKALNGICYPWSGNPAGVESLPNLLRVYRKLESDETVIAMLFELLCDAVGNGYLELVEELIRNGAPVDHRQGNTTWGDLLGSFFEMNREDKVFMALVDAGLDLDHPAADKYRKEIQKILKRAKR